MRSYLTILFLFTGVWCFGQDTDTIPEFEYLEKGNALYKKKSYKEAQKVYEESVAQKAGSFESNYNLGNAFYKQDSLEKAAGQFELASRLAKNKNQEAIAYHNLGNALLQQKKYSESIEAYKNALRRNPDDDETRYNLAYAKKMLEKQKQNQKNNKDQNKDQNKEDQKKNDQNKEQDQKNKDGQNKDKKDNKGEQDKKDSSGDKKDEQNKEGQKSDNKEQKDGKQPQKREGSMSKEQAQRLLNALDQEEEELRKAIRLKEEKTEPKYIEKDW